MKIFIATKNEKKLREIKRILEPLGFETISEKDLKNPLEEVEETGKTFEENALLKAKSGLKAMGLTTVADDSGLCVDYLGGKPGIYSARYSGVHGDDKANIEKLLKELENVKKEDRTAHFSCAVVCLFPDGRKISVTGTSEGYIDFAPHGNGGFGYDPIFISEKGCFAELSDEQKDSVSHRGRALRKFEEKIKEMINGEKI